MWLTANYSPVGEDAIAHARAIKTEPLRKLREMVNETPRNEGEKGRLAGSTNKAPPAEGAPTLSDLGITKKTSSRAQKLAGMCRVRSLLTCWPFLNCGVYPLAGINNPFSRPAADKSKGVYGVPD